MSAQQTTPAPTLTLERTFLATPERLWSHWTDPQKYAKWLNPAPIDLVIHEWDLRPGGKIRFDMPQPDGNLNPQTGVFHEIVPHKRLVSGEPDKSFLLTVTFESVDAKRTKVVVEAKGIPPEWHAMATAGWGAGFEKLEDEVAAEESVAEGFTLRRTYNAPAEKVWKMWTTPEGIRKWWVPSMKDKGFDMSVEKMDVRVGGTFAFRMTGGGHDLVNGGTYRIVDEPKLLAWTWHFDIFLKPDQKPYDVPIEVRLEPAAFGATKMTFTQGPLSDRGNTMGSRAGVVSNLEMLAKALAQETA